MPGENLLQNGLPPVTPNIASVPVSGVPEQLFSSKTFGYRRLFISILVATVTLILSSIGSLGIAAILGIAAMIIDSNVDDSIGVTILTSTLGIVAFASIFVVPILSTLFSIYLTTKGSRKYFIITLIVVAFVSILNPYLLMIYKNPVGFLNNLLSSFK